MDNGDYRLNYLSAAELNEDGRQSTTLNPNIVFAI